MTDTSSERDAQILCGLYLSRWDQEGLKELGFGSFAEAYNILGLALRCKAATIKNYRDEFDPWFPNARKGWHKRPLRPHCSRLLEQYSKFDLIEMGAVVRGIAGICVEGAETEDREGRSGYGERQLTGRAAENYFIENYRSVPYLRNAEIRDVRLSGCGYDFRACLIEEQPFLAVEVKGLRENKGAVLMTEKEYSLARKMGENFVLYIVHSFFLSPQYLAYRNPLETAGEFVARKMVKSSVVWTMEI